MCAPVVLVTALAAGTDAPFFSVPVNCYVFLFSIDIRMYIQFASKYHVSVR